jgi:tRNA threonylcarbamoyladenosine biosynthesis protein TsaE
MVVSLEGSLGVGKTTLVKGLAKALGIDEEITSPSFTIMSVYKAPITLYHIDLYRIDFPEQLADIGIDEVLYEDENGVAVIEWGAKAESLLPEGYIRVHFQLIENGTREITITGLRM